MEKFTNEQLGHLYGNAVEILAMIYYLGASDWAGEESQKNAGETMKTIVRDIDSILSLIGQTAQAQADEQEKTD